MMGLGEMFNSTTESKTENITPITSAYFLRQDFSSPNDFLFAPAYFPCPEESVCTAVF